jgi:hypothetical protein
MKLNVNPCSVANSWFANRVVGLEANPMKITRLTYGISGCCAIAIVAASFVLFSDTQSNQHVGKSESEATSPREQLQIRVPRVEAARAAAQESAKDASPSPPSVTNDAPLAQEVAELSTTVARLEQTVQNLQDRLSRSIRPLPTGDRTEAGLAGKKAELDAQARRYQAATAELRRFATRSGVTLDERVLTDSTFTTPLDKEPEFEELRFAATNNLRVLQAVERKFATDLLDRASFQ